MMTGLLINQLMLLVVGSLVLVILQNGNGMLVLELMVMLLL